MALVDRCIVSTARAGVVTTDVSVDVKVGRNNVKMSFGGVW